MSAKLAQRLVEPDFWTCPHGARTRPEQALTYGPEVADICATAGFAPDPQQQLGLDLIFAIRADGSPASFATCVICCRQNLKTGLLKQAVLGWTFVLEVPEVVWSSHEMSTTNEAHRELHALVADSPLSKYLPATKNEGFYTDNGSERIELANGQRIMFKARTKSGGRGLAKGKLVLDEAFALQPGMLGSLLPILLTKPHAQVLYASSAGKKDSIALHDIRDRGREGTTPRLTYLEWGGTPLPDCDDQACEHPKTGLERGAPCVANRVEVIESRNPTLSTGRITLERLADLRQEMPTDEWLREFLGEWEELEVAEDELDPLFPNWSHCADLDIAEPKYGAIGIGVSVDRAWSSIAFGGRLKDHRPYLGAALRDRGTTWTVQAAKDLQDATKCVVAIDGTGPGKSLVKKLTDAGVKLTVLTMSQVMDACADLYDEVETESVVHGAYLDLDAAMAAAVERPVVDRWLIGRRKSRDDVSMADGAVVARWALENVKPPKPSSFR